MVATQAEQLVDAALEPVAVTGSGVLRRGNYTGDYHALIRAECCVHCA